MKAQQNIWFKEFLELGIEQDQIADLIDAFTLADLKNKHQLINHLYDFNDYKTFQALNVDKKAVYLKSLDELIEHDKQREKDGFPKRIKLGKLIKPVKGHKEQVIIVPTTTEPKFYHDNSITEDENDLGETGGAGDEQEGEVLGQEEVDPQGAEGEGQGAGEGNGEGHDISQEAFDLGKVLTEQFELPNLQDKGSKRSLVKFKYDLTDINKGFGQLIDKKATIKEIIKKNILLGKMDDPTNFKPEELLISPKDHVFKIMSKEKDYESQAMVFFIRDYSGSMQGKPTEVVSTQHLLIYSWLMYQYQNRVENKFILHDTDAKEVDDFYTYYRSNIAGGTKVAPAFELVEKIIEEDQLDKDYNIYIFYGTDGDDWETAGTNTIKSIENLLKKVNRLGITIAKNAWSSTKTTTIEAYIGRSNLLDSQSDKIKLDAFKADGSNEDRIIEGIKKLIS